MRTYLKKGSKLGWCDYNPKIEHEKGVKKSVLINKIKDNARHIEVFKDNIFLREFKSASQLEEQSEELFGIKFDTWSIYDRCKNKFPMKNQNKYCKIYTLQGMKRVHHKYQDNRWNRS